MSSIFSGYLIVRNGPFRSSPIGNRRYCGSISIPSFISNTNALRIIFNASVADTGFSASYTKAGISPLVLPDFLFLGVAV